MVTRKKMVKWKNLVKCKNQLNRKIVKWKNWVNRKIG